MLTPYNFLKYSDAWFNLLYNPCISHQNRWWRSTLCSRHPIHRKIGGRAPFPIGEAAMFGVILRISLFLVGVTMLLQLELFGSRLITPNKALTIVLLALAIAHWLLVGGRLPRNAKTKWILAFYVSLALSTIYAATFGVAGAAILMRWSTLVAMFLFYFLMCYVIRTRRDLDFFVASLILSGVIASISAFFTDVQQLDEMTARTAGLGFNENTAAANVLSMLPFVYVLAITTRSWIGKALLLGSAATLVVGFVLAGSRAGFVGAAAMGCLYFVRIRGVPDPRIAIAATLLIVVGVVMSPTGYGDRLMTMARFAEHPVKVSTHANRRGDITQRISSYQASLYALATHPVLGVGLDRYRDWVPTYDRRMKTLSLHSSVFSVACQQGFLGLIPYLAILSLTYRDFSRAQRLARAHRGFKDPELQALHLRAVMAQLGYLGILIPSLFQPGTFWRGMWIMFAFSTVILSLTQKRVDELASETSSQPGDDKSAPPQGLLPGRGGGFNGAWRGV